MGEVYRARDTRLDRFVAVKILHSQLACTPELKMRFDREARTLSSLSHPHGLAISRSGASQISLPLCGAPGIHKPKRRECGVKMVLRRPLAQNRWISSTRMRVAYRESSQ